MTKKCLNNSGKINLINLFSLFIIPILFFSRTDGQTISISGKISSSRFPIKNASVTFIDNTDTTKKYSAVTDASGNYQIGVVTSLAPGTHTQPAKFGLEQNYPNPFSSETAIPYEIKEKSNVQVAIYDILGRTVRKFDVGEQTVGSYNVLWDGRNNLGYKIANGVYFYRLYADDESQVRKMIFNEGSNGLIPQSGIFSLAGSLSKPNLAKSNQGITYTARIENTGTTTPLVVPKEISNIVLVNDTTINFSVDYIPLATINLDSLNQYIRGFGAANILQWRPDMTNSEIETAFGTGDGQIGFSILRLRIQPETGLWNTNVPSAKKAHDMGVLVFASPWDAPANMLETVDGQKRVRHDMYEQYAAHLDSFNTYMTNNGVPLYAVSVQNEPDYAQDWTGWTPDEMLKFMKENASAIGTKVMAPESFQFRRNMSDPILKDSIACANLDIVGGHIYGSGLSAYPLAKEKGKETWMTEHLTGENNSIEWSWALPVAEEINDVMKAGMSAYVWWYIVRFYGPISDGTNNSGNKGDVTKKGYVMSQFARFIRPGFYRVESSVAPPASTVDVTAYKDPSSSKIVIVAINSGNTRVENVFRMQNGGTTSTFTPYTTSDSLNCAKGNEVSVTDGSFTYAMEPLSITTFVSK